MKIILHFSIQFSSVSLQFDENNSKSSNAKQSQIRAKIISKSKHIKKKHLRMEHHPQTSSFSVKHLLKHELRFVSSLRETERTRQTYTHNDIQTYRVQKEKNKKRKISSEKEHDPVTEPSHDRHFHQRGRSCARCPVSSIPKTNIQGFLKSGRCLPWKSITSAMRYITLKPLKQGTLLITCYPAVYDQRSPRKIFGKRIETYTSDTLSKRHCVAVYLPSVAHEGRGGC